MRASWCPDYPGNRTGYLYRSPLHLASIFIETIPTLTGEVIMTDIELIAELSRKVVQAEKETEMFKNMWLESQDQIKDLKDKLERREEKAREH